METFDRAAHWENIYANKQLHEVSWYQPKPEHSLALIEKCGIAKDAAILDVGGGDSFLSTFLIESGYSQVEVLDISVKALERAQERMGIAEAQKIGWIHSDIIAFKPAHSYTLWHDRAAFHFLTEPEEVKKYVTIAAEAIEKDGYLIVGTFADDGPLRCSGIDIQQYDEAKLASAFSDFFELIQFQRIEHKTPFETIQKFIFGVFKKF